MARRRDKDKEREVASARVARLLVRARAEALGPDPALADRHAGLVRRIAMKYQLGLSPEAKAQVCRGCSGYRLPGATRVRLRSGRLVTTCLRCGHVRRRPL
ncbi:MAG TPA: ribonuclease P, partial [Candidatus Thermoplasmatota archaeon]|nr:ribonuclease P [Candidatus Thermoplasmatota archaeon]